MTLSGAPKKRVKGASAGALGFSLGITLSEDAGEEFGFRTKLSLLCDELDKHKKGILILVDEAKTSDEMRRLAITYQHLVGEEKNIAIVMAGLPQAVSTILNDEVLTFLNRAYKTSLSMIRTQEIYEYYTEAFQMLSIALSPENIRRAAEAAEGFPYLMQLIGYYIERSNVARKEERMRVEAAAENAKKDMIENVFQPILTPLSDNDVAFLKAMSKDYGESNVSDICKRMKRANAYIQPYRARLIDAGIIESPRKGKLLFAIPYLAEYLRRM